MGTYIWLHGRKFYTSVFEKKGSERLFTALSREFCLLFDVVAMVSIDVCICWKTVFDNGGMESDHKGSGDDVVGNTI